MFLLDETEFLKFYTEWFEKQVSCFDVGTVTFLISKWHRRLINNKDLYNKFYTRKKSDCIKIENLTSSTSISVGKWTNQNSSRNYSWACLIYSC